jgi:hypothetical protein
VNIISIEWLLSSDLGPLATIVSLVLACLAVSVAIILVGIKTVMQMSQEATRSVRPGYSRSMAPVLQNLDTGEWYLDLPTGPVPITPPGVIRVEPLHDFSQLQQNAS